MALLSIGKNSSKLGAIGVAIIMPSPSFGALVSTFSLISIAFSYLLSESDYPLNTQAIF
jgi:hypothetical protein